jgi:UDP-N-acetyl-D-mannosaminuronate dehydrogenase
VISIFPDDELAIIFDKMGIDTKAVIEAGEQNGIFTNTNQV